MRQNSGAICHYLPAISRLSPGTSRLSPGRQVTPEKKAQALSTRELVPFLHARRPDADDHDRDSRRVTTNMS